MPGDADLEIEEAFRRAQKAHNNKAKLVACLKTRYDKVQHNYVNFIMYTIVQKFGGSIWQMNTFIQEKSIQFIKISYISNKCYCFLTLHSSKKPEKKV